jgi:hypothetical protein
MRTPTRPGSAAPLPVRNLRSAAKVAQASNSRLLPRPACPSTIMTELTPVWISFNRASMAASSLSRPRRGPSVPPDLEVPFRAVHRFTHCVYHVACPSMHPRRSFRSGGSEDDPVRHAWTREHHLLRHEAGDGEAEDVDPLQPQCIDERDRPMCHLSNTARSDARCGPDADIVEREDPARFAQSVDQRRVPVVQVPSEVLKEGKRGARPFCVAVGIDHPALAGHRQVRQIGIPGNGSLLFSYPSPSLT